MRAAGPRGGTAPTSPAAGRPEHREGAGRQRRTRKVVLWVVGAIVVILVGGRLALNPIVAARARQALLDLHGYRGTFDDVTVNLHRLAFHLTNVKIAKPTPAGWREPLFFARRAEARLRWSDLVHGHIVATIEFDRPKVILIAAKRPAEQQLEAPQIAAKLQRMAPLRVDRSEVKKGEILFIDATDPARPELWLHDLDATLENFASRPALERHEPTTLAASGTVQRSGTASLFVTADPLAKKLTFAGQARLVGLRLEELGEFLVVKAGLSPVSGVLDLSVRFIARDGKITGGIKPVLKNPSIGPATPNIVERLKAAIADTSLNLFSDRVPGRNAVATIIPIEGKVTNPDAQAWPAVIGILRNAFVQGLSDSLRNLPPPTSPAREAPLEQARKGLTKKHGAPGAQPRER